MVDEFRQINKKLEKEKKDGNLLCVHTNEREYNFNKFTLLKHFYYGIISGKVTIRQTRDEQNEINKEISDLEKYNPTNQSKIKILENARRRTFEEDIFFNA